MNHPGDPPTPGPRAGAEGLARATIAGWLPGLMANLGRLAGGGDERAREYLARRGRRSHRAVRRPLE